MPDVIGMPAEIMFRLVWKLAPNGSVLTLADGDGNVYFFPGSSAMTAEAGPVFTNVAAIVAACFNRDASQAVSGAQYVTGGCPIDGAQTFLGEFVDGLDNSYTPAGVVATVDIASPIDSGCRTFGANTAAANGFALADVYGVRDCGDGEVAVHANIARKITAASPSGRPLGAGRVNPGATGISYTLTVKDNANFGAGPGGLFPLFKADGTTPAQNPISTGFEMSTLADYDSLADACGCDVSYAGIPLTAAIVAANPELNVSLITGV